MLAFNKAVIERAMGAQMNLHLGYRPGEAKPPKQANERNGASGNTLLTDRGPVRVELPRDREGRFEPLLIPKHERRFTGFDERIIAMYARGMSVREIQAFLAESYGTEVSPDFISSVTDEVMAETIAWQSRPLEAMYPVVFFDALRVKIRSDGVVSIKAVYLALGIQADGQRDVLGLWIEQTEGAKFWLKVFNELKTRSCQDILIAVVDGLKGLAEAINTAYPKTTVQTCIVHLIRNSLDYAGWKDRKMVAAALRPIYAAANEQCAGQVSAGRLRLEDRQHVRRSVHAGQRVRVAQPPCPQKYGYSRFTAICQHLLSCSHVRVLQATDNAQTSFTSPGMPSVR